MSLKEWGISLLKAVLAHKKERTRMDYHGEEIHYQIHLSGGRKIELIVKNGVLFERVDGKECFPRSLPLDYWSERGDILKARNIPKEVMDVLSYKGDRQFAAVLLLCAFAPSILENDSVVGVSTYLFEEPISAEYIPTTEENCLKEVDREKEEDLAYFFTDYSFLEDRKPTGQIQISKGIVRFYYKDQLVREMPILEFIDSRGGSYPKEAAPYMDTVTLMALQKPKYTVTYSTNQYRKEEDGRFTQIILKRELSGEHRIVRENDPISRYKIQNSLMDVYEVIVAKGEVYITRNQATTFETGSVECFAGRFGIWESKMIPTNRLMDSVMCKVVKKFSKFEEEYGRGSAGATFRCIKRVEETYEENAKEKRYEMTSEKGEQFKLTEVGEWIYIEKDGEACIPMERDHFLCRHFADAPLRQMASIPKIILAGMLQYDMAFPMNIYEKDEEGTMIQQSEITGLSSKIKHILEVREVEGSENELGE